MWTFSKRCKDALNEEKIKVSIPRAVRRRLWALINEYDKWEWFTDETGWNDQRPRFGNLPDRIKAEIGCDDLLAFPVEGGDPEPCELSDFILRGPHPPHLFDTLELAHSMIPSGENDQYQREFNQIMEESDLPWRMANGHIFPVDSAYIEEVILRRAYSLLQEVGFQGALQEFEEARVELTNGDYKGAVQKANLAFESTMKGILGVEKARPGELIRGIIDSGIVPEYHAGFLKVFEEHILRCVPNLRNQELGAGHGQGKEVNIVPKSLAELAVNLAGVMIKFLIERHLDQQSQNQSQ